MFHSYTYTDNMEDTFMEEDINKNVHQWALCLSTTILQKSTWLAYNLIVPSRSIHFTPTASSPTNNKQMLTVEKFYRHGPILNNDLNYSKKLLLNFTQ